MILSEISKEYKNKSISLFFISFFILILFPLINYFLLGFFSGFGFIQINSSNILLLKNISKYIFFLSAIIPTSILFLSILVGLNRYLISLIFPNLVTFVVFGLLVYFLAISVLSSFTILFYFNEILGLKVIFIVIGAGLIISILSVIKPIINGLKYFINKKYIFVLGAALNQKDHKKIFDFLNNLCEKIHADKPQNILVGLSTDFYAVSKDVRVFNGISEKIITDNTLYISLPLLRVLTINEFGSILAHELGHFEGDDTVYSAKFAPVFRKLNGQLSSFEKNEKNNFLSRLAIFPIILLYNEFTRKEEKLSKSQELKADQVGAKFKNEQTFINALAKLYIFDLVWHRATDNHREIVREKGVTEIKNLSKEFVKLSRNSLDNKFLKNLLFDLAKFEQKHPNDTHPPLYERMKNLNIKMKDVNNKELFNFLPSAASLINNIEIIEQNLTHVQTEIEKHLNK